MQMYLPSIPDLWFPPSSAQRLLLLFLCFARDVIVRFKHVCVGIGISPFMQIQNTVLPPFSLDTMAWK